MNLNPKQTLFVLSAFISLGFSNAAQANLSDVGLASPGAITDSITDSVTNSVDQNILRPLQPELQQLKKPSLDLTRIELKPVTRLNQTQLNPLANLPEQLEITDFQGHARYIEIEVENGWRAIQFEWLLMLDKKELDVFNQISQQQSFLLLDIRTFDALDMTLVRFKVKQNQDSYAQLRQIFPATIASKLDRNHIYQVQQPRQSSELLLATKSQTPNQKPTKAVCQRELKVGMLDTEIELKHAAFDGARVEQQSFIAGSLTPPKAHGTAVAALLISQSKNLPALLPDSKLYSAAIFHRQNEYTQGASLFNLIKGMNWLLKQQVTVINMSLAGPDNPLLAKTIEQVINKQVAVVAAAGNEGPVSAALYPAAYPEVIGVTAVDNQKQIYRWANQGDYIDFAAPGVSVPTARIDASLNQFGVETGTSIATPVITAFVACYQSQSANYFKQLSELAEDLGTPGKDSVFGYGLLTRQIF